MDSTDARNPIENLHSGIGRYRRFVAGCRFILGIRSKGVALECNPLLPMKVNGPGWLLPSRVSIRAVPKARAFGS